MIIKFLALTTIWMICCKIFTIGYQIQSMDCSSISKRIQDKSFRLIESSIGLKQMLDLKFLANGEISITKSSNQKSKCKILISASWVLNEKSKILQMVIEKKYIGKLSNLSVISHYQAKFEKKGIIIIGKFVENTSNSEEDPNITGNFVLLPRK